MKSHFSLDPNMTFLNHGSFGACPSVVVEKQLEIKQLLEQQPVRFYEVEAPRLLREAREAIAPIMGANADDLAFVPNATTGVNAAMASFPLAPGDEILVTDQEYNACRNVAAHIASHCGAKVVVCRIPFPIASPDQVVDAILSCVTPRTGLALVDHITSQTALIFPIARIVAELKSLGVETIVDGAHALGMTSVNVQSIGAAYYTTNAHKWLCAPKVAAILHVRPDMQETIRPTVISHGANAVFDPTTTSRFRLEFDWPGTADVTAYLAIPKALEFLSGLFDGGLPALAKHNHNLVVAGRGILLKALDMDAPAPTEMLGSMASIILPDSNADQPPGPFDLDPLKVALWETHRIEVPIMPWPAPPGRCLRISAQVYNTPGDYRLLADVLPAML